jgi:formylmethanofuran dehydrogenase subunit C
VFKLTLREASPIPLEMAGVTPDRVRGLSAAEVAKLPVLYGNRRVELGQFFDVTASTRADLHLAGDTRAVKHVGAGMTDGFAFVEDSIGMHAGAGMTGGRLVVDGGAGDWLGAEMTGGFIEVRGSAGSQVGAAYRGGRRGMNGGTILIRGDAGDEVGLLMRRGLIAVSGRCGEAAGASMIAGTVVAAGGAGRRLGAGMKRGTLLVGGDGAELPPSFRYSCSYRPAFVGWLLAELRKFGVETAKLDAAGYHCHRGDLLTGGKGEVLMPT